MPDRCERVAHRGGSQLAPENTLAAFRHALTLPIDAIELDVQMIRDGQLVVFHDNTMERLTNGMGNVLDLDFAYLRSLNAAAHFAGGWPEPQQIPTLREVLTLVRGHVKLYIEIKRSQRNGSYGRYPQIAQAVVSEVQATAMVDQVVVISFDWSVLAEVKSLEPAIETGMIVSRSVWNPDAAQAVEMLMEQASSLQCGWINLDLRLFTPEILAAVHHHGLKEGIWTVNTEAGLRSLAEAGVDSLTSDRPDLFAVLG
ncbi:MAG TPA: glycerophosphodiester phosphodiesterase [Ktedonobacteraceae bacterium]|nr:glycerophosphodiester phosphodiesterase [Ktedonobacteraceae bacterium]